MSWRDSEDVEGCDMHQALYRDDGELLGMVLRLHGGEETYAYTVTPIGCAGWARAGATTRPGARSSARSALRKVCCGSSG
jgi:hypothetical protein